MFVGIWVSRQESKWNANLPTLTAVRPSSSDALLPPPVLLPTLIRLLLLGAGLTMALSGRGGRFPGDVGGLAIVSGKRGGPDEL